MNRTPLLRPLLVASAFALGMTVALPVSAHRPGGSPRERRTTVSIQAGNFLIDGQPTLKRLVWRGRTLEGLLH
jgi:hypothetical protein